MGLCRIRLNLRAVPIVTAAEVEASQTSAEVPAAINASAALTFRSRARAIWRRRYFCPSRFKNDVQNADINIIIIIIIIIIVIIIIAAAAAAAELLLLLSSC